MDRLRSMEVFVSAVERGSFSAAARELDLSPVMVGKYVRQLETHLGAQLLQRNTRAQSLTDAGRRFYEESRKVLEQLALAEASVESLRAEPRGRLRITAATTLGACVIAPLAAEYQNAHPQVRIELDLSNSVVDLVDEGFDVAVRIGDLNEDLNLVARPVGVYRMAICASPGYLARHGTPRTLEELAAHRCLGHSVWDRRNGWRLAGDNRWPADTTFLSNDGLALRQAALHGAGLLLQPAILVADDLAAGRLVSVLEDATPAARPVHALYRQDRQPLPKIRSFVGFLEERARAWLG
ncbi:DNA-binding transcriptional LysR family regulator [Paraburkholderia bannensis]|uniref:DNA-binding transcriptional LysR family regulator n=1 Tax=Paraburkholderia bannensis TaxID=765414 RepID=A0A7W9U2N1_9BURK|nr:MULTISPECIES: LysR family transcriptional regulator [Paraburkholderia]MBB3260869.1 DNA-binding transcriptional LysR family regulator [Paraburkholderia sp. WP4_3_2]MBB6105774.1 DNA-binding transcriptional LysR family regulator [Paraburkholderia bannensis]